MMKLCAMQSSFYSILELCDVIVVVVIIIIIIIKVSKLLLLVLVDISNRRTECTTERFKRYWIERQVTVELLYSISQDFSSTSKCCQKRLGSGGANEPWAAITDKERAFLKSYRYIVASGQCRWNFLSWWGGRDQWLWRLDKERWSGWRRD